MDSGRTSSAHGEDLLSDEELTEDTPSTASKRKIKRWTDEEHGMLVKLVEEFGDDACWATIAEHIPGRTGKQCRERWVNHIGSDIRKGGWTAGEEEHMARLHANMGAAWTRIASALGGRTENSVKNHFNALLRSKRLDDKRTSVLAQYVRMCRDNVYKPGEGMIAYEAACQLASQAAQELSTCITSSQPSRKQANSITSFGSEGEAKTTAAKQARSGSVNPGAMKPIRTGRAKSGSLGQQKLSQNSQGAATPMSRPILGDAVALVSRSCMPAGRFENGSESAPNLHGSGRLAYSSVAEDCQGWFESGTPMSTLSHHHSKTGEANATLSHGTYTTPSTPTEGMAAKRVVNKAARGGGSTAKHSAKQNTPSDLLGAMDLVASFSASLPPVQGVTPAIGPAGGVVQDTDNINPLPASNINVPLPEVDAIPANLRSVWEANQSVLPSLSWKDSFGVNLAMGLSWTPDTAPQATHAHNKITTNQATGYTNEPQGATQVHRQVVDLTTQQNLGFENPAANPAAGSVNLGTTELPEHTGFASAFGNQVGVDFGSPKKTAAAANHGLAGPVMSMLPTLASYDMFGVTAAEGNDALSGRMSGLSLEAILGVSPMAGQPPNPSALYFSQGKDVTSLQSDQAAVFYTSANKSSGGGMLLDRFASSFGGAKPLGHRSSIELFGVSTRPAAILEDFTVTPSRPLHVKTRFGSAGGVGSATADPTNLLQHPVSKPPSVAGIGGDASTHHIGDVYLTWKQETCPSANGVEAPRTLMQGDNRRTHPIVSLGGCTMVPLGMVSAYPTVSERGMLDILPELDVPPPEMLGVLDILFDDEPLPPSRPPLPQSMGGLMQGTGRLQPPPHRQGSMHETGMLNVNQQQAVSMDIHNVTWPSMNMEPDTRQQAGLSQQKIPLPPADLTIALSPGQASKRSAGHVFGDAYSPGHSASKKSNYIGSPSIGVQQQQYSMESSGTQHPISVQSSPVMQNNAIGNGLPVSAGHNKGAMYNQMQQRKADLASQLLQGTGAMLSKEDDLMGLFPSRLMSSNGPNWGASGWGNSQFAMTGAMNAPSPSLAQ